MAPFFSESAVIDWHDGMVAGAAKQTESDQWFLLSLFYIDFSTHYRVFNIVKVPPGLVDDMKKLDWVYPGAERAPYRSVERRFKSHFRRHIDDVLFLKIFDFRDDEYSLVKPAVDDVRIFSGIDQAFYKVDETLPVVKKYFPV